MKHVRTILGLSLVFILVSCGGGGGNGGGTTLGSGSGSGSQTLLTITMTGDYFAVPASDADFSAVNLGSTPTTGLVQATLGPNGFPRVTAKASDPATRIFDVDANSEIQWWTTNHPGVSKDVAAKSDPLPFTFDNFYPTGQNGDQTLMRTAHWKGPLTAPKAGSLIFNASADDDLWIFIDGVLVVDDGGVKTFSTPVPQTVPITAGAHTLDIFYADRSPVKATLALAISEQ